MKKIVSLVPLLLLIMLTGLKAQNVDNRNSFAIRYIASNYQWPLEDVSTLNLDEFTAGFEAEYFHTLNNILDLSFPLRVASAQLPQNATGDPTRQALNIGLDALLNLNIYKGKNFRPRLFAGVGGLMENSERLTLDIPLGLGLDFRLAKSTFLSTTAAYHLNNNDFRDHLQAGIGLRIMIGEDPNKVPEVADRDGDGIPDATDLCPDKAGTAALNGCPDRDGDGVADGSDNCPDVPGTLKLMGCPDTDNDGIADKDDKCPNEVGPASNDGCPVTDRDGDGVADVDDLCPDEAGSAATKGCPDRDGDGVPDKDDACPNQPGTPANGGCPDSDNDGLVDRLDACPNLAGPIENKGCPEIAQTDREVLAEAVQAIEFETGSATLRQESYAVLDKVVDILQRYAGYKVRIGGHTDSIGSSSDNLNLSKRRAKACYDYLLSKGINATRMSHEGYGESQPIGDNRYAPGREKNRRVEFDVYIE
ncbi:OmpA family protein [Lewinella sp. LCG006]|uniref:OmpA family protein n=1 Tax=Lewinella sp. LCG006 TaxID=3231911 RepID=UPI003460361B